MATLKTFKVHGNLNAQERIDIHSFDKDIPCVISSDGSLILKTKNGEVNVDDLINRLNTLEQTVMELLLLGPPKG